MAPKKRSIIQNAQGTAIAQATDGSTATVNLYQDVSVRSEDADTIAAGQQQLGRLPLETIPAIVTLPPGSIVPFAPNPMFIGRASDLRLLATTLKDSGSEDNHRAKIAAITGLGGIGKTQLATEFVHRYGQYFAGGVFWLSFAKAKKITDQVAECGRSGYLNLRADFHNLPSEDQICLVLGAWQSPLPRLLVFDNCEDEAVFAQWKPPTGASHVLLTSRHAQWDATLSVKVLPLGELQLADSVQLLHAYTPGLQASDADFVTIATELGNLPLALHLAGSFLGKFHRVLPPQSYLAQLRKADPLAHSSLSGEKKGIKKGISATAHDQNVSRTFEVSYRYLDGTNPTDAQALALLSRVACFAPGEPIPHRLLLATLESTNASDESLLQAESALLRLLDLGLVEWVNEGEETLRMHRLLVKFLQQKIVDTSAQVAVEQALATQYEQIRAQLSPGTPRTSEMNQLVALVLSFMKPGSLSFRSILEAIRDSQSAFEQYHALLAARELLPKLNDSQKSELVTLLQNGAENVRYITEDRSRHIISMNILGMLGHSAGVQYKASEEQWKGSRSTPRMQRFGWIPDLPDQRDFLYATPFKEGASLPSSVDLRGAFPPIHDQGESRSDTASAIAAAIEFHQMDQASLAVSPSRLFIYYNARAMEENIGSDSGAQIRNGLKSVAKQGVCSEKE